MIGRICLAFGLLAALPGAPPAAAPLAARQPAAAQPAAATPAPQGVPEPPAPLSAPAPSRFRIPPQPVYPVEALRADIRGRCIVTFTVDAKGVPQNIVTDCTDPVFAAAARDAAAAARLNMDAGAKPGEVFRLPLRFAIE